MHTFQKVIRGDHTKLPGFRQVLHPPLAVAELEISITPVIISLAEIRFKLYSFPEGQQSRSEIAKFGKHVTLVIVCKSQPGGKLYGPVEIGDNGTYLSCPCRAVGMVSCKDLYRAIAR